MPFARITILALLLLLTACTKPYAAESNLRLTDGEQHQRHVLDAHQQAEAVAAMRSIARGHERSERPAPGPAPQGIRWSDVPLAVRYAAAEVDMAIVRTLRRDAEEQHFLLVTLDERPAELRITRVPDKRVYEAAATVGRFHDDADRAARLVQALHTNMQALGRKRAFE